MTDHCMGETGCACHPTAGLYPYGYPLVAPSQPPGLYGTSPYGAGVGQGCVTLTPNATSLYTTSTAPYDFKDSATAWRSAVYPAGYYTYDASMPYPYGNGYGAINGAAHTKNATKEATSLLKSWLNDHMQNPYPTKGEKIMLAIITKMTLTQVSTWFANARRRLKKENKMTWSPRNRYDDDDDDKKDDDDDDKSEKEDASPCKKDESLDLSTRVASCDSENRLGKQTVSSSPDTDPGHDVSPSIPNVVATPSGEFEQRSRLRPFAASSPDLNATRQTRSPSPPADNNNMTPDKLLLSDYPLMKPRIWSIAETATSEALAMRPRGPMYPFLSRQKLPQSLASSLTSQFATTAGRQWPWNQGAFRNSTPY